MTTAPDEYKDSLVNLTQALIDSVSTSQACSGLPSNGPREYWASVLFARLCGFGISILRLTPESVASPKLAIYDFPSVATLTRSLFECYLTFGYLSNSSLTSEEFSFRLFLTQLHDCHRRPKILAKITGLIEDERFFEQAKVLRRDLEQNAVFKSLPEKLRQKLLRGDTSCHLTQDELLAEKGMDVSSLRGMYEFLSSQVHSFPFAYLYTPHHVNRGTGRPNEVERRYIGSTAKFAASILSNATNEMRAVFTAVSDFPRLTIDWDNADGIRTERQFLAGMSNPKIQINNSNITKMYPDFRGVNF
jgi:hypothetical protein